MPKKTRSKAPPQRRTSAVLEELGQVELRLHGVVAALGLNVQSLKDRLDKIERDLLLARGLGELQQMPIPERSSSESVGGEQR